MRREDLERITREELARSEDEEIAAAARAEIDRDAEEAAIVDRVREARGLPPTDRRTR